MPSPAVSVVVPVRNRIEYLGAALASIREQTFGDFEVVVLDAGSTEPVAELVREVSRADSRFRVVSERGLDCVDAREAGLAHAQAPLVALLDSDDLMEPRRLELQVPLLQADPGLALVAGALRWMDAVGLPRAMGSSDAPAEGRRPPVTDAEVRWTLPFESPTLASAMTFRADSLAAVGGFDRRYPACDDYATVAQVSRAGRVWRVREPVGRYRIHAGQMSTLRSGEQQAQLALLRRSLLSDLLGQAVPLSTVVALVRCRIVPRAASIPDAAALLDRILARFTEANALTADELAWVRADHVRRRAWVLSRRTSG